MYTILYVNAASCVAEGSGTGTQRVVMVVARIGAERVYLAIIRANNSAELISSACTQWTLEKASKATLSNRVVLIKIAILNDSVNDMTPMAYLQAA